MKSKRLFCLLLILALTIGALALSASAATIVDSGKCGDNVTWTLDENGKLIISGTGDMYEDNFLPGNRMWSVTSVEILPGVTSIGEYAFQMCSMITSVSIPDTVTSIGRCAFDTCGSLTSVSIPDGVTRIEDNTFFGCSSLSYVILPTNLTSIGIGAFGNCGDLQSLTLPQTVTYIGDGAFYGTAIQSMVIPDSVTSFGCNMFSNCRSLTYVKLPEGISTIGYNMFNNCEELTSIEIPSSVTYIDEYAFTNCVKLKEIVFKGNAPAFAMNYGIFQNVVAKAYYPVDNTTWTKSVMQNYGGTITWVPQQVATITQQLRDVAVLDGATAKVTLGAKGDGLTYKWYYKNPGASKFTLTTSFKSNSYSIVMNEDRDGRQVYCVITDKYGNEVKSDTVTLSLKKTTAQITQQPKSVSVANGAVAKITVGAEGDGLTYRWYYKNPGASQYTYTSSFRGNTYYVTMNDTRDGRQVLCRVYDKYGNVVQTNTVKLSMKRTTVKITTQPKSVTVAEGAVAKVTVSAVGDGLTYRWYFKNPGGTGYSYTSSFQGNTYYVTMNDARNGRQVLCRVYDQYGNVVQTNTVILKMK